MPGPDGNIRIGMVGVGAIAQIAHLPILRKIKGVEIVALCDSDGPKARALSQRLGVDRWYTDIEDLLQEAEPDAVLICTPSHLHEAHAIEALTAGAHVVVERPIALTAQGVARVLKAAEKADRHLLVALNHRFRSDVQAVHQFIAGGELGTLTTIRTGWHTFRPLKQTGWRARRQESGGGVMMDLGMPMVDLAWWIAGRPEVERVSAHYHGSGAVDEIASAHLFCADGLSIFCDVSWRYVGEGERFWLDVQGTRGSGSISPFRVYKELHGAPADVTPTGAAGREHQFTASYRSEWAYFLAGVRGQVKLLGPDDQVRLHRILEAIARSAEEQRDVKL